MNFTARLERLRRRMKAEKADALLLSHLPNIRYACNFTGSSGLLLVTGDGAWFFSDGRYREQARGEVRGARVCIAAGDAWAAAAREIGRQGARHIAVEAEHLAWGAERRLAERLGKRQQLTAARGWVEELRAVKEPAEVAAIRAAVELGARAFPRLLRVARAGVTEIGWAAQLELALRQGGGEGLSFDTIIASGARAAHVHGRASEKTIEHGELVIIDYGVWLAGYASDMTRTVAVGAASRRARALYAAVWEAQQAAIAAVRPGAPCRAVDEAARAVLRRTGWGRYFVHSTGHGVGLEIHEMPRLARQATGRLAAGNVITIEPGAYVPGWGGARIEDVVAVTERGADVLTPAGGGAGAGSARDLVEIEGAGAMELGKDDGL